MAATAAATVAASDGHEGSRDGGDAQGRAARAPLEPKAARAWRGRCAGEGWVPQREAALEPKAARRGAGESSSSSPAPSSAVSLSPKVVVQSQLNANAQEKQCQAPSFTNGKQTTRHSTILHCTI